MSIPNYSYCVCYCPNKILNCPHYEKGNLRGDCTHHILLSQYVNKRTIIGRSFLEETISKVKDDYKKMVNK